MIAEVISIGDELTSGERLDTNSQWLSQRLGELGIRAMYHTTVADDMAANVAVFRAALERADLVVATGGLGPTADDLTRQALAAAAGVDLVQDDGALAHIRALFARRKREMPPANLVQAMFPRGSRVVHNPHGSAPGIDLDWPRAGRRPSRVFCLPGVPAEMREMWAGTLVGAIESMLGPDRKVIRHKCLKCFGVGESDLEAMLPDMIRRGRDPQVGITVSKATITLRVTAAGASPEACAAHIQPTLDTIHQCLGDLVYGEDDDELQHAVIRLLAARRQSLATWECGTRGLMTLWLNECAAATASQTYRGGRVVDPSTAAGFEPADAAARIRLESGADYAVAVGPLPPPETPGAAPGDVVLAIASPAGVERHIFPYTGHPDIRQARTAKQALNLLRLQMLKDGK